MTDADDRRSRIMSLCAEPVRAYGEGEAAPPPVGVEGSPAGIDVLQQLIAKEPIEKLVQADKYSMAKWKIQIWFSSDRSMLAPIAFSLTFWESGKRLHGGGDESAFICRRKVSAPAPKPPLVALGRPAFKCEPQPMGCDGIIPGGSVTGGRAMCPDCGIVWDTEHIADALFYRVPVERAAVVICDWFRKLGSDCDLFLKYRPEDVRAKMMAQTYGLLEARRHKGLMIYPLAHIMKDLSNGAAMEKLVKGVLLA